MTECTNGVNDAEAPFDGNPPGRSTQVELVWIEGQLEHWIRFGHAIGERILSRRTRILSFDCGAIFALVRWASNDHGTVVSRIDIVRAVAAEEAFTSLPFVRPGGELLLSIEGWVKVEQVLRAIDRVEEVGIDPADAAPDHWRHVHNRIAAGDEPRRYSLPRHCAFELRRGLEQ